MAEIDDIIKMFSGLSPEKQSEAFEKLSGSVLKAGKSLNLLSADAGKVKQAFSESESEISKQVESLNLLETALKVAGSAFDNIENKMSGLFSGINRGNLELMTMATQIGLIAGVMKTGLKPEAFNEVGKGARDASGDIGSVLSNLDKMTKLPGLQSFGGTLVKAYSALSNIAEPAKQFEYGLISLKASSGELGELLGEVGDDFSLMEQKSVAFINKTTAIGNALGLTSQQVASYFSEISKIPEAMDKTINVTADGKENVDFLQAALLTAVGTGQSYKQVLDQLSESYKEFNTTGRAALENISKISLTSQNLKLPLDLVRDYATRAASSFRFFGDNTQGATNILERFAPTLAKTMGPKAFADLNQNIVQNISQLSLASRSFLSATTGGKGGLAGGYQIELLKQQGKIDQIERMVEDSLRKQFGGKIVTLEEAARDQASAGQFTKQVQLLTQGPTKIAGSEAEAYKILEAMAKGVPSGVKETKPGDPLAKTIEIGNKIQERNYNQLVVLSNLAEKQVQLSSINANNIVRSLTGTDGFMANMIEKSRNKETELAAGEYKIFNKEGLGQSRNSKEETMAMIKNAGSLPDKFKEMGGAFMSFISNEKDKFKEKLKGTFANDKPLSSDRNVSGVLEESNKAKGFAVGKPENNVANVNINSVCPACNKKMAEEVALKIVDGKIVKIKKNEALHIHTGANIDI